MKIRISISKVNKDKNIDDDIIMKENININTINNNKTQPVLSEYNKKKFDSNIFPLENNYNNIDNYLSTNKQKSNNNINQENKNNHVTPSNKTSYYDISSHILNDSLHIPNTGNANPNLKGNNNLIDFV